MAEVKGTQQQPEAKAARFTTAVEADALQLVRIRNDFYIHGYRRAMTINLLMLFVTLAAVSLAAYLAMNEKSPRYFATTQDGRIVELLSLGKPNHTDATILAWAQKAAVEVFSFNYINFRHDFQSARGYFTAEGYDNFIKALSESGNLQTVQLKQLTVHAEPYYEQGAPAFDGQVVARMNGQGQIKTGLLKNRYSWQVVVPLVVRYVSDTDFFEQRFDVTMTIVRVSALETEGGIGIAQFVAKESVSGA